MDENLLTSLTTFWAEDGNAVSFYISEAHPDNLAHQAGVIAAKETARDVLRRQGDKPVLRPIVKRLEQEADEIRTRHPRGVAIFAAPEPETWIEVDLPYKVKPRAHVGNSFVLGPLAKALSESKKYFVLLLDRSVTRLLMAENGDLTERTKEFGEPRQPVRETGASRKKSDERSKDDEAFHHLRHVGERVMERVQKGEADHVYVGCRTELWAEIEAAFPDNLLRKTIGHFHCDPSLITVEELRERVLPELKAREQEELENEVQQALGAAAGQGKGAVGPEEVAVAIEMGEVQKLLIAPHEPVAAGECTQCSHIEIGRKENCTLCGGDLRQFDDFAEVAVRRGAGGAFEVGHVPATLVSAREAGFVAKLRFRADRSTEQAKAEQTKQQEVA